MMNSHPLSERPRERCLKDGTNCLSLRECLALILGSGPKNIGCLGVAEQILNKPGAGLSNEEQETAFFNALEGQPESQLQNIFGLGDAGKTRLLASYEIARRYLAFKEKIKTKKIKNSEAKKIPQLALQMIDAKLRSESKEWLGFVPIYRSGKVGKFCLVERGVRTHVNTDTTEFFSRLLSLRPGAFILVHNHPSQNLAASQTDLFLTQTLGELAERFGIQLVGHWIVTSSEENWVSFPLNTM